MKFPSRLVADPLCQRNWETLEPVIPSLVTSLPSTAADNQVIYYQPQAGVVWTLRYNAVSTSAFKWEFAGGNPMTATSATSQSISTSFSADATCAMLTPFAGDYRFSWSVQASTNAANGYCTAWLNVNSVNGVPHFAISPLANYASECGQAVDIRLTVPANVYATFVYQSTNTSGVIVRGIEMTPIRVG